MAKTKVGKIDFRSVNGINLDKPVQLDIFYEGTFFIYTPDYLIGSIKSEDCGIRMERKDGAANLIVGNSPNDVRTKLWHYLDDFYRNEYKEEKIIHYNFRYNSRRHPNYKEGHSKSISFADTPAMSLTWGIHYLITFHDGRQVVISSPFKNFGTIIHSGKFSHPLDEYTKRHDWIYWTEDRELFFNRTEAAMEDIIGKVSSFFGQDPSMLTDAVDSMPKLIR